MQVCEANGRNVALPSKSRCSKRIRERRRGQSHRSQKLGMRRGHRHFWRIAWMAARKYLISAEAPTNLIIRFLVLHADVRYWPKADIASCTAHVCFWG